MWVNGHFHTRAGRTVTRGLLEVRGTKGPRGPFVLSSSQAFRNVSKGKNPGGAQHFTIKISITALLITKIKIAQIPSNSVIRSPSK